MKNPTLIARAEHRFTRDPPEAAERNALTAMAAFAALDSNLVALGDDEHPRMTLRGVVDTADIVIRDVLRLLACLGLEDH